MAYNTKASSSSSLKNASDNLCEINKAYNTSQATEIGTLFLLTNYYEKTVTKFMKILFVDEVAAKFSWTGQKENKQKFETLFLWKIIFGCKK
ncbi:uncharacterized protein LOC105830252 isoform X2 [Monomorium pharaonis]|uniref:uncharacterized protein LOC105830252 isoform X2 n=1 Tax=Monomorium pharaonis TaxID=307658 RepID=UPI001746D3B6|nr:uncharacterized protein LOC105830252 isoform X2 [Monomorium pharaonis]